MLILLFTMACHMIAHRFAITPKMDFQPKALGLGEGSLINGHIHGGLSQSQPDVRVGGDSSWFGFWETRGDTSDFVVRESVRAVVNGDDVDTSPSLA